MMNEFISTPDGHEAAQPQDNSISLRTQDGMDWDLDNNILHITHQWEPIASVVKDGTTVFLAWQERGLDIYDDAPVLARWDKHYGKWMTAEGWAHNPTHWFPVPTEFG